MKFRRSSHTVAAMLSALLIGCTAADKAPANAALGASAADSAFTKLAQDIVDDFLKRHPSNATDFGLHAYDGEVEDLTATGVASALEALRNFRTQVGSVDTALLSPANRIDREFLLHSLDGGILAYNDIKRWARDPDFYSSGVTTAAYVIMRRPYAPAADRLRSLISRERKMPGMLLAARANLGTPPRIYTEIALDQIDGNISFFKNDLPGAFTEVTDSALLREFRQTNDSVMTALAEYKKWMQNDLLPKSTGNYAYGADLYQRALAADDMIDVPISELLVIAETNRKFNEDAFQAAAKQIDSTKTPAQVLAALELDHPPADKLLAATQATLDSLRQFLIDKHIITIPPDAPSAQVLETPPFMRATTSASMETPGPLETVKLDARYNMTLPDPRWSKAERDDFMRQWYYGLISNVSVHEVYPGHYTQFLHAKSFPSMVRKLFGAASNSEGWAHYTEQMMLDEGFHNNDPKYRLAQAQDALLRNVRFIVGIKMHTQGMTVDEATKLFQEQAHQVKAVAVSEAKRGTSDALYGYYTMGKLMILKLREDYKAKLGAEYSLQKFHDEFIKLGPLPLPLVRKAMLGETGKLFP
jgi:uncharacterized protein (DUF885 family)